VKVDEGFMGSGIQEFYPVNGGAGKMFKDTLNCRFNETLGYTY